MARSTTTTRPPTSDEPFITGSPRPRADAARDPAVPPEDAVASPKGGGAARSDHGSRPYRQHCGRAAADPDHQAVVLGEPYPQLHHGGTLRHRHRHLAGAGGQDHADGRPLNAGTWLPVQSHVEPGYRPLNYFAFTRYRINVRYLSSLPKPNILGPFKYTSSCLPIIL